MTIKTTMVYTFGLPEEHKYALEFEKTHDKITWIKSIGTTAVSFRNEEIIYQDLNNKWDWEGKCEPYTPDND